MINYHAPLSWNYTEDSKRYIKIGAIKALDLEYVSNCAGEAIIVKTKRRYKTLEEAYEKENKIYQSYGL